MTARSKDQTNIKIYVARRRQLFQMNTIPGRYLSPLYAYNARGRCILLQNSLPLKRKHPQQQQKEKGFLVAHMPQIVKWSPPLAWFGPRQMFPLFIFSFGLMANRLSYSPPSSEACKSRQQVEASH
jgi:hypothetical protein